MRVFFAFFLTISLVFPVFGKQVDGLYEASVVVIDQSAEARKQGAKAGLIDVLYKVSGFPVPADNKVIERAISMADQYLYQFSFARVDESEWSDNVPPGSSYLKMQFEGKSIQRIIRQAQLPRWGISRPTIMTWVAIDDGARHILSDASEHKALEKLKTVAKKRGLPLVLPIYDLEDSFKLPMEQLWGLFKDGILAASDRYDAASVLAGRIYRPSADRWVGNWRFYFKGQEYEYQYESTNLEEQLLWGVSAGGTVLADAFALKPSAVKRDSLMVSVVNVSRLEDYGNLLAYLKKLAVTKQVSLIKVSEKDVLVELSLNGSFQQFKQSLSLNNKLIEMQASVNDTGVPVIEEGVVSKFKWQP